MTDVMQMLSSPVDIPNGHPNGDLGESEEDDVFPEGTPRSYRSNPSPRCEAFVMTGEKMLRLNSKISPIYAQAKQEQLPPETPILYSPDEGKKKGPFDDFPSWPHKISKKRLGKEDILMSVPSSHSEHVLGETPTTANGGGMGQISRVLIPESQEYYENGEGGESCVTVNALCAEMIQSSSLSSQPPDGSAGSLPNRHLECRSEPVSPAKYAFGGDRRNQSSVPDNRLIIAVGNEEGSGVSSHADDSSPLSSVSSTPLKEKLKRLDECTVVQVVPTDSEAAARLAKRLYSLDGFRKSDVASHLAKNNDFGAHVALEYVKLFNFAGLRVDAALRKFLSKFCLVGESSDRERVLTYFARRYHESNPGLFLNDDDVHTIACALLLLNTDLHGQNIGKKMSCRDFIDNLSHAGFNFSRDLLKTLYTSIKTHPIEWARDSLTDSDATLSVTTTHSQQVDCRFFEYPDPESQVEYKKGWVMRKCLVDADGKKTPFGRRGWKMFYATLKGLVLYLHKDEQGFKRGSFHTFRNAIRIYHSFATRPQGYNKRQHVFRLRTANLGEFLFQTSDPQEVQSWTDSINCVAASFSSPALPPPVSSSRAFHKPLLPSVMSKASMEEQLLEHEKQVEWIVEQLEGLKEEAPSIHSKGRPVQEFFFKERYLEEEKLRYVSYAHLLRAKLSERVDVMGGVGGGQQTGISSTISEVSQESSIPEKEGHQSSSGQSDRLSYRAAISNNWVGHDNDLETVC